MALVAGKKSDERMREALDLLANPALGIRSSYLFEQSTKGFPPKSSAVFYLAMADALRLLNSTFPEAKITPLDSSSAISGLATVQQGRLCGELVVPANEILVTAELSKSMARMATAGRRPGGKGGARRPRRPRPRGKAPQQRPDGAP